MTAQELTDAQRAHLRHMIWSSEYGADVLIDTVSEMVSAGAQPHEITAAVVDALREGAP